MADTYQCENCGGVFQKTISDYEAWEEAYKLFPTLKPVDAVIVCDDCFKEIMEAT